MRAFLRFWPLAALLVGVAVAWGLGVNDMASFDALRDNHLALKARVTAHPIPSFLLFLLIYTLLTAVAVPGAVVAILAAGYLFGPWVGGFAVAVGATAGSVIKYYAVRTAFGERMRQRASKEGSMVARIRERLDKDSFFLLLTLRLIPPVPFVLVSIAAGLAAVPVRPYTLASFIGVLPSSVLYATVGSELGDVLDRGGAPASDVLMRPQVLLPLLALAMLSLLPLGYRWWRNRRRAAPFP
jgi:uncharacterized membrane protein YdjX (TVP38/TMEM64 family)